MVYKHFLELWFILIQRLNFFTIDKLHIFVKTSKYQNISVSITLLLIYHMPFII